MANVRLSQQERAKVIRFASDRINERYDSEKSVVKALRFVAPRSVEGDTVMVSRTVFVELVARAMRQAEMDAKLRARYGGC